MYTHVSKCKNDKIIIIIFSHLYLTFKKTLISKPGMVAHAYNPSTWEAEARGS
jgi:hypothetical protein